MPSAKRSHFDFLGDYRAYYAGREPLCYSAIEPISAPDRFGVRFSFASNFPGLQRIEWAEGESGEESPFRPLMQGELFLPFDPKRDEVQDRVIRVHAVFSPGIDSPIYTIRINWMTRAAFLKAGGRRSRDIVKITSDPHVGYGTNKPENWKSFRPNAAELAFAQEHWAQVIKGVTSDYEKAKRISKALIRELRGCDGLPSAFIYDLPTFDKYEAIRSGRSKFACAQYSEIFSKVCNAFGVVNRWGFNNDNLQNDQILLELGSSHLVTEIFDRDLNQWVFLDGHAQTLGAYIGSVGPLTLHEFFLFMNQANRRPHLNVVIYNPEKDTETTLPVDQSGKPYRSYRGWTKGFHTEYLSEAP
ncbi:MAG: hypothetical protein KBA71_08170 [Opitutaceae bacterium]|nr:hypothetical protein [Opitutaceae bacterium]